VNKSVICGLWLLALAGCQDASPQAAAPPASPMQQYAQEISAALSSQGAIPPAIAALGIGGSVRLKVVIAPSGAVVTAYVDQSSGTPALDDQAMDNVAAAHFPPFLPGMPQEPLTFVLPINFPAHAPDF
jgi:TonB family protein